MAVAVADAIESMRATGHAYRDQAVLCRGNEKLSELALDLERLGIPVLFLGSLFERPEIKDLVALLSILTDRRAMGLVRVACWPSLSLSLADVAAVLDHLRNTDAPPAAWLSDPAAIPGVSAVGVISLRALAGVIDGLAHDATPWISLATILLDRTRIAADLAASNDIGQRTRGIAIWQFLNFVRTQPAEHGLPITRLMDRIRRLLRLSDERDLRQLPAAAQGIDAVRLVTMHGAKGLEFSVVHIPGMNADSMPGSPLPQNCPPPIGMIDGASGTALQIHHREHAQEQECLFYVALSRARDRLFLYAPTKNKAGAARKLSPFLDRLGAAASRSHIRPARVLPPLPGSAAIELVVDGRLSFEGSQLALFESCPGRFFYSHVLQVGGRRTTTAFMQMHEAVRTVFRSVVDSDDPVDEANLPQRVDSALAAHGLTEHGHVDSFREFALAMVRFFLQSREAHTPEAPTALTLPFGEEQVIVRPDAGRCDGSRRATRGQRKTKMWVRRHSSWRRAKPFQMP